MNINDTVANNIRYSFP